MFNLEKRIYMREINHLEKELEAEKDKNKILLNRLNDVKKYEEEYKKLIKEARSYADRCKGIKNQFESITNEYKKKLDNIR